MLREDKFITSARFGESKPIKISIQTSGAVALVVGKKGEKERWVRSFVWWVGGWVSNIAEPLPQSVQGILFFFLNIYLVVVSLPRV